MSVASVATDVVRYAYLVAQSPQGHAAILTAGGPVADLFVQFGLRGLGTALATIAAPTISEETVEAELMTKGWHGQAYDPATFLALPAPPADAAAAKAALPPPTPILRT